MTDTQLTQRRERADPTSHVAADESPEEVERIRPHVLTSMVKRAGEVEVPVDPVGERPLVTDVLSARGGS
jgi:hypothetical protein